MAELQFQITGNVHQVVETYLQPGQRMFSETGGMVWMDPGITLETSMAGAGGGGGVLGVIGGALSRAVSGTSMWLNYFTPTAGPGRVAFVSRFPGKILDFPLQHGQSIIVQRHAFLAAEESVSLKIEIVKRFGAGLLGGDGFILQRISGPGHCFLEIAGEMTTMDLQPGQAIRVHAGHVAAFQETVHYDIEFLKGFKNLFFGGDSLALAVLVGPGRVWIQHQTMHGLAMAISPYLPSKG
jgi:uncharacterized protein (TIGR00266 family)